jgi:hypothetical protein
MPGIPDTQVLWASDLPEGSKMRRQCRRGLPQRPGPHLVSDIITRRMECSTWLRWQRLFSDSVRSAYEHFALRSPPDP